MADHQQSSEASAMAYPPKQIGDDSMVVFVDENQRRKTTESEAFMDEIVAELAASGDVRDEFLDLLKGFGNDGGGGAADDAHAVTSRAAELLRGHPDALRRFTAFIYMDVPAEAEQILALTRSRRSRTSRRRSERRRGTQQQTPVAAQVAAAAARNDGNNDDDGPRRSAAAALAFVKRVHDTAGPVIHGRFLAVLSEAKGSEDMPADEIYNRAKRAFGPAHVGLLHAFATVWLPGEQEWKMQQQQARVLAARQRSRAAAAAASHAGMTDAKKKPRADDDGNNGRRNGPVAIGPRRQRNSTAAASSHAASGMPPNAKKPRAHDGDNGRRHDHVIAVLEVRNVKKRRSDDDGLHRIGESLGGGAEAPQGRDDDYDYAARSRAKKAHVGNGEFSCSAAATRVLGAVDATGVHHAYTDSDNDKKPPRRRVSIGGKISSPETAAAVGPKQQPERDDEVRRFRQEWEFQTWYSKLVATSDRVMELLRPTRTPHGDADGAGGGNRSLEALFPLPECREFLKNCYGDRWGKMRAALELGESRVPALEAIKRRLTAKEEEAVVEESRKRCRHDPGRVAQRLHELAMHYTLDEDCQRAGNIN